MKQVEKDPAPESSDDEQGRRLRTRRKNAQYDDIKDLPKEAAKEDEGRTSPSKTN